MNPTTTHHLEDLQAFANQLADQASQRLLGWFGKTAAGAKGDGSVITEADVEVDRFVHSAVRARYPQHGLVSEEISRTYEGSEHTWVVDPLDGTTNFANGLAYWGVSIALLQWGEPLLATLDFPLLKQRFNAVRGGGARLNGNLLPLHKEWPDQLQAQRFFTLDSRGYRHLDVRLPGKPRILGSAAYNLVAVAAGVAIATLEIAPKVWDLAASWLVSQEAGVTVAPWLDGASPFPLQAGQDYSDRIFPLLIAANPALWQEVKGSVSLKPDAEKLAGRLRAQGWRFP